MVVQGHLLDMGIPVVEYLEGIGAHFLPVAEILRSTCHICPLLSHGSDFNLHNPDRLSFSIAYSNFRKVSSNIYNEDCKKVCYYGKREQKGSIMPFETQHFVQCA